MLTRDVGLAPTARPGSADPQPKPQRLTSAGYTTATPGTTRGLALR